MPEHWAAILLAAVLGALLGIEREIQGRPAGLRTHILVSMGAALFTILSRDAVGPGNDSGRIAAQIVAGVGFLGAGTIMHQGVTVRGLTTAAGMWVAAAVGMACGFGPRFMGLAVIVTLLTLATLALLPVMDRLLRWKRLSCTLDVMVRRHQLPALLETLNQRQFRFESIRVEEVTGHGAERVVMAIHLTHAQSLADAVAAVWSAPDVLEVHVE